MPYLQFDGESAAFPLTVDVVGGQKLGEVVDPQVRTLVAPGPMTVHVEKRKVFLDTTFGPFTLALGQSRRLTLPGITTASISMLPLSKAYVGLSVTIDGSVLGGPYPKRSVGIAASKHRISIKWPEGDVPEQSLDLTGRSQVAIQVNPESVGEKVTIQ